MKFKGQIKRILILNSVVPIVFVAIIFLAATYFSWYHFLRSDNSQNIQQANEKMALVLDDYSEFIDQNYRTIINLNETKIYEKFYDFLNQQEIRGDFYLLNNDYEIIAATNKEVPDFLQETATLDYNIRQIISFKQTNIIMRNYSHPHYQTNVLEIGRQLAYNQGYLIVTIDSQQFDNFFFQFNADLVITNQYDRVYAASDKRFVSNLNKIKKLNNYIFAEKYVDGQTGLKLFSFTSLYSLSSTIKIIALVTIVILILMILTLLYSSYKLACFKSAIIEEMVACFTKAQQGNLDCRLDINTHDEFELIGKSYNSMLDSLKVLMKKNEEQVQQNALFQIKKLESQFNPHFLFNTLEVIKYAIHIDPHKASNMIVSLSKILRYSIDQSCMEVLLKTDIKYLEAYLYLIKSRFSHKFTYNLVINDDCYDLIIPKLVIQPLIENSIKYTYDQRDVLHVDVYIYQDQDKLMLELVDNGLGIDELTLKQLNESFKTSQNNTNHLGLYNINRRIQLLYGLQYGIELISNPKRGTLVVMTLPIKKEEKDD